MMMKHIYIITTSNVLKPACYMRDTGFLNYIPLLWADHWKTFCCTVAGQILVVGSSPLVEALDGQHPGSALKGWVEPELQMSEQHHRLAVVSWSFCYGSALQTEHLGGSATGSHYQPTDITWLTEQVTNQGWEDIAGKSDKAGLNAALCFSLLF